MSLSKLRRGQVGPYSTSRHRTSSARRLVTAAAALAIAAGAPAAQSVLFQSTGDTPDPLLNLFLSTVTNYSGNGGSGLIIGSPGSNGINGDYHGGRVTVLDGAGNCVASFFGTQKQNLGSDVASLDIDGDGKPELILGEGGIGASFNFKSHGRVLIYPGGSAGSGCVTVSPTSPIGVIDRGTTQTSQEANDGFGSEIAIIGDVDNDGIPDVAIGAPNGTIPGSGRGYVGVYSSASLMGGSPVLLYQVNGTSPFYGFGSVLSKTGDITGDGVSDLAIGSPNETVGGEQLSGRVFLFDGVTGALVNTFDGPLASRFGCSLDFVGDLDGDGVGELAVGAYDDHSPYAPQLPEPPVGSVRIIPSAALMIPTGSLASADVYYGDDLYAGFPNNTYQDFDQFGFSVANIGDIDADGMDDLLVGATVASIFHPDYDYPNSLWPMDFEYGYQGTARLISLGKKATIKEIYSTAPGNGLAFGSAMTGGVDFDGDGTLDFAVAASEENASRGVVRAFSGVVRHGVVYAQSNPNSTLQRTQLAVTGSIETGAVDDLKLLVTDAPPNVFGLAFYGQSQTSVPLGDGLLLVGGPTYRLAPVQTDANGSATIDLNVSTPPNTLGQIEPYSRWNFQFWHRDTTPAGVNLSDAITVGFY